MAGVPCIAISIATAGSTIYVSSHPYTTASADTPASTAFLPRLINDVSFERRVGTHFWREKPRGTNNFGVIEIANADGAFDSYVGSSLRDKAVTIKRGNSGDAYSTFSTVATLIVDRIDFTDEDVLRVYVKDISAKLDRALQTSLYPTTLSNAALRGRPRPITVGRCYQVPLAQPDMTGNGHYDVHDGHWWCGIEQLMDQGATIICVDHPTLSASTGYERSHKTGIYGPTRTSAVAGKQVATVLGAFKRVSTVQSDDFTSLAGWTETNGGVGGRDASISSNTLRMLNTAGGAALLLSSNTSAVPADSWRSHFFYEFDCATWTSGYVDFQVFFVSDERRVDEVGHYAGMIHRAAASFATSFQAVSGSNADLTIDNFRLYSVTPIEKISDFFKYLTTSDSDYAGKGPLTTADLDTSTLSTLETAAGYSLGLHASDPLMISDALDDVMQSFGGWWYVTRTGLLTAGRLVAPSGTASYTFDQSNIAPGMRVSFDEARGLSNLILAKRNWSPYTEAEIIAGLSYVQLNSSDKDADVTLSNSNYTYSAANAGSVRNTPGIFGDRIYFEVTVTAVGDSNGANIGIANSTASLTSGPGFADVHAISYSPNGNIIQNGSTLFAASTYTTNDVIGLAVDLRPMARGESATAAIVYARKNGTYQNSGNPATDVQTTLGTANASYSFAHFIAGSASASTKSGVVNFGQSAFTYDAPDDYTAPAWHRSIICQSFRYSYESTVSLHASYTHADSNGNVESGTPTLISKAVDARTECDRWATLYSVERFFYEFDVFLDSVAADQIEPGNVIEVTYPRFGLSAKKLVVVEVKSKLLDRRVSIRAWG